MSFSSSAVFVLLMVLGQLMDQQGVEPIPYLQSKQEVEQSLRSACGHLVKTGPFANLDFTALVEFQRQALQRVEAKKAAYIEKYCAELPEGSTCNRLAAAQEFNEKAGNSSGSFDEQMKIFSDFSMSDGIAFFDAYCVPGVNGQTPPNMKLAEIANQYNKVVSEAQAIDLSQFDNYRTSRGGPLLDDKGQPMGAFIDGGKVVDFVPSNQIPDVVRQAFIAAEDKNFYTHRGIEPKGILRGFFKYMEDGSIQGGSTITQQLVKNLITGNDVSMVRKAKEMILARRLENRLQDKEKILNAYLNIINLGRGANGIGTATKRYFGEDKKVSELGLNEASFFAGITHSPARYNPSSYPEDKIRSRQKYVLGQMINANTISKDIAKATLKEPFDFQPIRFPKRSYYQQAASIEWNRLTNENTPIPPYITTTQNTWLQDKLEVLMQEHLAKFEMKRNKVIWKGPLTNIAYAWEDKKGIGSTQLVGNTEHWYEELLKSVTLFQGVHWRVAVLLKKDSEWLIGALDDAGLPRVHRLSFGDIGSSWFVPIRKKLKVGDVIFVKEKKDGFFLRVPTTVQGAAVVMDVQTGEVKALSGGFNYNTTQFNRALFGFRQPGSTVKPFTFLAALNRRGRPDSVVAATPVYFQGSQRCPKLWSPKNYSPSNVAAMTLENGLVYSNNRLTGHILYAMGGDPLMNLDYVYGLMQDFGLYARSTPRTVCFPTILGSEEVTPLRLARAFAAFANGGYLVEPVFLKPLAQPHAKPIRSFSPQSLSQMTQMLSKVVTNGTGNAAIRHAGRIAGKTGTSSENRDVWFAAYSNRYVVTVWTGYDSKFYKMKDGRKIRTSMCSPSCSGVTGGQLVAPVVADIFDLLFEGPNGAPLDDGTPLVLNPNQYALNFTNPPPTGAPSPWMSEKLVADNAIATSALPAPAPPRFDINFNPILEAPEPVAAGGEAQEAEPEYVAPEDDFASQITDGSDDEDWNRMSKKRNEIFRQTKELQ